MAGQGAGRVLSERVVVLERPKEFGGPELSYTTISKVVEIISAADSSIGQIAQNHIGVVAAIRTVSDEAQQKLLFGEVLKGVRFGNAFTEFGSKRAADFETRSRISATTWL